MNTAFMQYVFSGLTFRAYAARFEISVPTLLRAVTGLEDPPPELDPHRVRSTLVSTDTASLYIAMQGPKSSIRWHQWQVEREVALAILNDEDGFSKSCREQSRLYIFSTIDNLVVAINPQHIVTAIFGHEELRSIEQKALVPSQLVSGNTYLPQTESQVLQEVHNTLRQAAEQWPADAIEPDEALYTQSLCENPGYVDQRPSMAYLRDLKAPFQDRLWASGLADRVLANNETLCSQLGSAIHIDDKLYLPTSVALIDHEDMPMHLLLPFDQTSVLQVSRWTIERTVLERQRRHIADKGNDLALTPERIRADSLALGLYGVAEIEEYVAEFMAVLENAPAPKQKRRGRSKGPSVAVS